MTTSTKPRLAKDGAGARRSRRRTSGAGGVAQGYSFAKPSAAILDINQKTMAWRDLKNFALDTYPREIKPHLLQVIRRSTWN